MTPSRRSRLKISLIPVLMILALSSASLLAPAAQAPEASGPAAPTSLRCVPGSHRFREDPHRRGGCGEPRGERPLGGKN